MPLAETLMVPSKAGAWVPTPSAFSRPLTPLGSFGVDSPRWTPLVSSSFFFAAASVVVGSAFGLPESLEHPTSAPEPSSTARRTPTSARARAVTRSLSMPLTLSDRGQRGDRPGHGGDRLRPGEPRPVAAPGRLGQVDRRAAGRGGASRPRTGPGQHQGVLALE